MVGYPLFSKTVNKASSLLVVLQVPEPFMNNGLISALNIRILTVKDVAFTCS